MCETLVYFFSWPTLNNVMWRRLLEYWYRGDWDILLLFEGAWSFYSDHVRKLLWYNFSKLKNSNQRDMAKQLLTPLRLIARMNFSFSQVPKHKASDQVYRPVFYQNKIVHSLSGFQQQFSTSVRIQFLTLITREPLISAIHIHVSFLCRLFRYFCSCPLQKITTFHRNEISDLFSLWKGRTVRPLPLPSMATLLLLTCFQYMFLFKLASFLYFLPQG